MEIDNGLHALLALLLVVFVTGDTDSSLPSFKSARTFDNFNDYLEPALVPVGTFIALRTISQDVPKPPDPTQFNLPSAVQQAINAETADDDYEDEETTTDSEEEGRLAINAPSAQVLAGIRPLASLRLPLGIFVPDQPGNSSEQHLTATEKFAKERKVILGIKSIFRNLRRIVRNQKQETPPPDSPLLNYNSTFNGLVPLEAVYMPRGVFVPISSIPGQQNGESKPVENLATYFSGLVPLSIVDLPPGIYIPHRMNYIRPEDIPSQILPRPPKPTTPSDSTTAVPSSTTVAPQTGFNTSLWSDEDHERNFKMWIETEYNPAAAKIGSDSTHATWNFETNITDENQFTKIVAEKNLGIFSAFVARYLPMFKFSAIKDPKLRRLYVKISSKGDPGLNVTDYLELEKLKDEMEKAYSTARICADPKLAMVECPKEKQWGLTPEITRSMASSRDPSLLLHLWKSFRDETGPKMRKNYVRYVELKNMGAAVDGFKSAGRIWRLPFEEPDFKYSDSDFLDEVLDMWNKTLPLYEQLHAYMRRKLTAKYPEAKIKKTGAIPAHLLGHINGYHWANLKDFTLPYPKKGIADVTAEMKAQNWTVTKMFVTADQFMTSLGLQPMPESFWTKSMFNKPPDRQVMCQPSSFDFSDQKDFRIKMCADITAQDLGAIHHEMGRIQYFIQYKNLSAPFRKGANTGFSEAIGDTFILSVISLNHQRKIQLLPPGSQNTNDVFKSRDINFLYLMALDKVAYLPFAYLVDMYRYDVFAGRIKSSELNTRWWQAVLKYQGICAPAARTEDDFDPGAKYHVSADVPYIRFFISTILQFQFHKALCSAANFTEGRLHECDIDGSKTAGQKLQEVMALGNSVPWQVAMEKLTGSVRMDASAMLEYFQPLYDWLVEDNEKFDVSVGWDTEEGAFCPS